jgi:hypothetical protein
MTMRVNTLVTHLRAEDALTLIEFLDQLRELLIQTYGDEIKTLLQEAAPPTPGAGVDDDLTF